MQKISRFFIIVEGENGGYPKYQNAAFNTSLEDPCNYRCHQNYISSPLFSLLKDGVDNIPVVKEGTIITFVMMPSIYPNVHDLRTEFSLTNQVWFTLGLANLLIFENVEDVGLSNKILAHLADNNNLVASESWIIKNSKIDTVVLEKSKMEFKQVGLEDIKIKIPSNLPLHLEFAISEYIQYSNKFLTASKKFTPQHYEKHIRTINASRLIVNNLLFLNGNYSVVPDKALLSALGAETPEEAKVVLEKEAHSALKEELLNDNNGRLIQYNSSLSYVYSQMYSGTFPLFDHSAIMQRHSLLGIGTAILSLQELLMQIEVGLFFLPFENVQKSAYSTNSIPSLDYFESFGEVSTHNHMLWLNDNTRKRLVESSDPIKENKQVPVTFFNRLAFYSGRLGFREYDLSATAAIQVLVESNSLQWNVINYTHEIIHNHVRIILNQLLIPRRSLRNDHFLKWLSKYLGYFKSVYRALKNTSQPPDITYVDYFVLVLMKYCINANTYGSLSKSCNKERIISLKSDTSRSIPFRLPSELELHDIILDSYRDISEIFVHVIDFTYIYARNVDVYIESIWASWSTVTSVSADLKQYILRTLIVLAVTGKGRINDRFEGAVLKFKSLLKTMQGKNKDATIYGKIYEMLGCDLADLEHRFSNCIIVGDLVYNFFIGELETFLDNADKNRTGIPVVEMDKGDFIATYSIETNSFEGDPIRSKVRFLQDQLIREITRDKSCYANDLKERTSAWLLLSLSSYNYD